MTAEIVTPTPEVPRDRWGRPLVVPPSGGRAVAYTRCTTFVSCLEDTYNLSRWQQRMVALGLAGRPDLALAVAAHRDNKTELNKICEAALEAAQASASATTGTALHALTEQHDRGQRLGVIPPSARADIDAYIEATRELEHLGIEQFVVHDGYQIGGTFDRLVRYQGRTYIADIKTGSIDYAIGKIQMQLAVYSRSVHYDPASHERRPLGDIDRDRAIIIHLPAGEARCRLLWVDIAEGWEGVTIARAVRGWRARQHAAGEITAAEVPAPPAEPRHITLVDLIAGAKDVNALTTLWRQHAHEWTPEHTALAAARKAQLIA